MAEAGETFKGRGNGTRPGAKPPGNSSNSEQAYWAEQERKAEDAAAKAKAERNRREFNAKHDEQERARQDRTAQDREASSRRSNFNFGGSGGGITGSVAGAGMASGGFNNETNRILKDILAAIKSGGGTGTGEGKVSEESERKSQRSNITAGVLTAGLIRDVIGLIGKAPSANTGLDLLTPFLKVTGSSVGGFIGSGIDAANISILGTKLGDIHASTTLSQLGKEGGEFVGTALTRSIQLRNQLDKATGSYRALTGREYEAPDLSGIGMDQIQSAQLATSLTRGAGRGLGAKGRMNNANLYNIAALKIIGDIDDGLLDAISKQSRTGRSTIDGRLSSIYGIMENQNVDRIFRRDAVSNSSSIYDMISASGVRGPNANFAANHLMFSLNKLGGQFGIGDPDAQRNYSSISEGLTHPDSAIDKAINYNILRKLNPNIKGLYGLRVAGSQALNDPRYLRATVEDTAFTGNEDLDSFSLERRFPGLNPSAIQTLLRGVRGGKLNMSDEELSSMMKESNVAKEAKFAVPQIDINTSKVTNAFILSFTEGISTIKTQFVKQIGDAIDEITDNINGKPKPKGTDPRKK